MAWVLWFTGLPGSGKTTIVQRVKAMLSQNGISVKVLQLDEIRKVITPSPTYTEAERDVVYASLAYMAKLLEESGINVIIDATANKRRYRDLARSLVSDFAEVYIRAPLDLCIARESRRRAEFAPKDIYRKSTEKGATVPGVNIAYEEPLTPEISVDSAEMSSDQSAQYIVDKIIKLFKQK